jgi:putative membrane protein
MSETADRPRQAGGPATLVLWTVVVLYAVLTVVNAVFPNQIPVPILIPSLVVLPFAFALLHGVRRYMWAGIIAFLVMCLAVSNLLENTSILTGFPFGHYHYTGVLGPKLFLVPLLIGPAYFGTGYLAWVLATLLVGDVHPRATGFTTFTVPFIGAFMMVAWDLVMDPTSSTIRQVWIWEQGGGYFGVPLTNFLGWFFTVYVFFQLFAIYLRFRRAGRGVVEETVPRSHYGQAVVMYAVIGLIPVVTYLVGGTNAAVTDAAGNVWHTRSIAEAAATVSIFTMLFAAALSTVKLLQQSAVVASRPDEAEGRETVAPIGGPAPEAV